MSLLTKTWQGHYYPHEIATLSRCFAARDLIIGWYYRKLAIAGRLHRLLYEPTEAEKRCGSAIVRALAELAREDM